MSRYIYILLLILTSLLSFDCERDLTTADNYSLNGSILLLEPKGGERYTVNDKVGVQWSSSNLNESLRIELINDDSSVYSVNDIPNTGNYLLQIPADIIPSKKYQLKIESAVHPDIFDMNRTYFEIAPLIDGRWYYSDLTQFSGLEINLLLSTYINESFVGSGTFHLKYLSHGNPVDYYRTDTVSGILSFPDIGIVLTEQDNKEFNFIGKMLSNSSIKGRIFGFIDSTYGSLDDSLVLVRQ